MRGRAGIMVGIAVVIGGVTVIGGRYYLERVNARPAALVPVAIAATSVETTTVVVAKQALRFGMVLTNNDLQEVQWPSKVVPAGSIKTISEFLKGPEKRVVIAAMEANEPVLASKVTGPGERATLSAVIALGMTAISIPLNETQGIAGLVVPGDRVNVMLTKTLEDEKGFTDVVVPNVRVVAVDQVIDQRTEKPAAIRSATLEVAPIDAKRLALAGTMGSLSLMLRKAGDNTTPSVGRISAKELLNEASPETTASHGRTMTTIKVTRNGKTEEYSVLSGKSR
jgi:pilus assembly protein CpaB